MAHELEMTANGAAFAYVGKHGMPWHNLGTPVDDNLTPEEMATAAHLDWLLEKAAIFDEDGKKINGAYNLRRATDRKHYDIVGDLYKPVQPKEALEFFANFVKAGQMKMETAGSLNDGRRLFGMAKMETGFVLPGGDKTETYLLISSPNFAGEAMTIRFCNTRVVCANTLRMAISEGLKSIRINHLAEFDKEARERAAELMGLAVSATKLFGEQAAALAKVKADERYVIEYVHKLTGGKALAEDENAAERAAQEALGETMNGGDIDVIAELMKSEGPRRATRNDLNRVGESILQAIETSPGSDMLSAKGTWWGALNGVTYVADHEGNKDPAKRYESSWFGNKGLLKDRAFDLALEYAGVRK